MQEKIRKVAQSVKCKVDVNSWNLAGDCMDFPRVTPLGGFKYGL